MKIQEIHAGLPRGTSPNQTDTPPNTTSSRYNNTIGVFGHMHTKHNARGILNGGQIVIGVLAITILSMNPITPEYTGIASYYTVASSGSLTASGEYFRDDAMTCAMRTGRFGEYYLVVAENGKSVVVKLNDRGPFHPDRVIDLSKGAMRKLHGNKGLLKVSIYKLGKNLNV